MNLSWNERHGTRVNTIDLWSRVVEEDFGNEQFYDQNFSSIIQNMFRRPNRFSMVEDDDAAMEATLDEELEEEELTYEWIHWKQKCFHSRCEWKHFCFQWIHFS